MKQITEFPNIPFAMLPTPICKLENITVTDEEIEKAYTEVSQRYGVPMEQLKATFGASGEDKLRKDICMKKAIAFLEANAQIVAE